MRSAKKTAMAAVLVALLVPAMALAQPGDGRGRGGRGDDGPGRQPLWEQLDLTDAQKETLQELRRENRQAMVRLRGEIARAEAELRALMLDPAVEKQTALDAQAEVTGLRADAARLRLEHRFAVRELLTPEQRERMEELRAERPGHGAWGGPGKGRRGCDGRGPHGPRGHCDGEGPHGPRGGFRD